MNGQKNHSIFLDACIDPVTGELPNYGSNDGALFFKLTNDDYRVYRSQLDDLTSSIKWLYILWFKKFALVWS